MPMNRPEDQSALLSVVRLDLGSVAAQVAPTPFTACVQDWQQGERAWKGERARLQEIGAAALARLDQQLAALDQTDAAALSDAGRQAHERLQTRIAQAVAQERKRLQVAVKQALTAAEQALASVRTDPAHLAPNQKKSSDIIARQRYLETRSAQLDKQAQQLQAQVQACARLARMPLEAAAPPVDQAPPVDLDGRMALVEGHLARATTVLDAIRGSWAHAQCRAWGRFRNHLLAVLPCAAWALLIHLALLPPTPLLIPIAVAAQILVVVATSVWRWRLARLVRPVARTLSDYAPQIAMLADPACHAQELNRLMAQKQMIALGSEHATQAKVLKEEHEQAVGALRRREQVLGERLRARAQRLAAHGQQQAADDLARRRAQLAGEKTANQAELARQLATCDQQWAGRCAEFTARWQAAIEQLGGSAEALLAERQRRHPAWSDALWADWTPPTRYASDLPLGSFHRALGGLANPAKTALPAAAADAELVVPALLTFPGNANLLVRVPATGRADALQCINAVTLRALAAFPGGGLRLTLIDPVGLGDSFAHLLALKDHDDALLGSAGVLVEPERIEQGLQDLSLHLETVIQKRLRGQYDSLYDYNLVAGELREAIRLVVVADFPNGFGERALERLNVIARSGPRCGVHLMLLTDERRQLPPPLELAWFRANAVVMGHQDGRLRLERDDFDGWSFTPEVAPPPDLLARIIKTIGEEAHRSRRVAVHFANLSPAPEAMWSLSSAASLRIPVGKRGAEGLQYFELGRGTAQHALIGGRTGSGKSTLFHVLITSAALWYAPDEVQFHLIDFKKGVEFKIYATQRLPHAQVIAIESDREFGLSVLRQLDQELTRRGDAFRQVGAQDLAAFRAASGGPLPRLLLLIDEFQEFFTEDDTIARDAALLLDRFVRQGRAFGLHVVLGSQTLGGSYSMAKSSIGQMGVRIALPCNEADAHLLLHEDNDAARLLSRPGDAIYNDRAGLAEGNSPFQVCWLPEDQEAGHLQAIAARTRAAGWHHAQPPVVFEGNGPSRLEDMIELAGHLAAPPATPQLRACVGQSSSLKGPAEVTFPSATGGNLLILGQNREAAVATCAAIAIGLAARWPSAALRLLALDGEEPEGPFATVQAQLAAALPHPCVRHDARGLPDLLAELSTLLEARQSGSDAGRAPVVLMVFALQRLRQLRSDDDALLGRDAGEPPAERFARLLANGPEYGIHIVLWCDSLSSLQRSLGRRAQRDFDARILFQMSAADSNELMDDESASRLGLHTALLSVLAEGRRDKFRPFSAPTPAFLEQVRTALAAR